MVPTHPVARVESLGSARDQFSAKTRFDMWYNRSNICALCCFLSASLFPVRISRLIFSMAIHALTIAKAEKTAQAKLDPRAHGPVGTGHNPGQVPSSQHICSKGKYAS